MADIAAGSLIAHHPSAPEDAGELFSSLKAIVAAPTAAALRPLRPHQDRARIALRTSVAAGHRRPMVQMPTGGGKTLVAAHIVWGALGKGKRVAFVVPALSLIDQTVTALETEGIDAIGVMQGIHPRTDRSQPVQVCSVQTIARRKRPEVDIVIVDEAHQMHREIFKWMKDCPDILFIGLSATPWARGLGKFYDDLIIAATTADLIHSGWLSPFVAYAPSEPDLAGVRTVAGEFHEGELADACDTPKLVGDIITTWFERAEGLPTFAFCVNRRHAQHVAERFAEAGVAVEYMDGETQREEREATLVRFRAGETKVICNVGVLTTGVDLDVRCIVDAKPTKSRMLFVQTIGRGLRTAPGKDRLVICDHAGNHLRLGMVTDIGQDRLDDGKDAQARAHAREKAGPRPRLCGECRAVVPHGARACPECGAEMRATTDIESADGELVELGSRQSGARTVEIGEKARFYAELRGLAAERGYAVGWVSHKYHEKFGVWPNDPRIHSAPMADPSLKTRNWVKSRAIAFAKARGRAHG